MELNFSKKTRKIVASLLAVAILLGVLPVSGLTGNSSGAEGNNGSANTIFVKSDHQPVLFDSNGNVKSVLTKKDGTYTGTNVNSSDQIVFLRNDVAKGITVGNTIVFYKKSSNTSTTDDAEPYDRIHVWKENGEPYKEWKSDDAIMKKYSGNLYYYIYPSDKNKVIFHNGLNDDEVGVKKSKEWDLNEWQVYTKNGLAGSLLNTLPTCKVGDNNAFSYYSGKITSEKIEKSDKFGATVTDVAGNESDVFKNDKITFYKFLTSKENSEALIDNVKVNDVDGFKGVVTAQKLKEDCTEVEYTYTYTDNTYGIKFTDTKTVNYTFEAPLSVSGKWNVKVNDKEVTANDKLYYKDKTPFNKITVSFDNAKVTYGGKEISGATNDSATEDGSLKSEYFLNDKEVSSAHLNIQTDSNKSKDENILKVKYSYTVNGKTYETSEKFMFYCYIDSTEPEITSFEFATVESDVDKVLSFLTFGIYNNDQVVVTVNAEDKNISSGIKEISLYNGDTLLKTQEFDKYISNGSATFTLNKSDELYKLYAVAEDKAYNCGKKWTFNLKDHNENYYNPIEYNLDKGNTLPELVSYSGTDKFSDLTVTPEKFKHQSDKLFSYKENGEAFKLELSESLSALSEATVTVDKDDSKKEFSDTVTFDTTSKDAKKGDCKLDYDLNLSEVFEQIGVKDEAISGNYTITVVATNNAGVSSKAYTYDFSIDNTAPEPKTFTISGESATDKILKFLTFGIYSKNTINVKVTANDVNPSSGIVSYTLYDKKDGEYSELANITKSENSEDSKFAEFTIDNRNKEYNLFVTVTDEFENTSNYYTFDYTGDKRESYVATDSKDAPEVVRYDGKDKFSDLAVTPENFKHQSDKLFSYKENGEAFKLELSESLSALSEATVTVSKEGSTKLFTTNPPITFDTTSEKAEKDNCKLDYDLKLAEVFKAIGVSGSDISGKYTIKVKATNNAGVRCEPYTYDFSIDNTAPVITLFAIENGSQNPIVDETSSQEYRYYFQHNTNVTVTAKDSASGVKEIHFRAYDVVKKDNAVDETKTVSSNNNAVFEVPANFKGEIYAYAVDKFDNSSIDKNIQGEGEKKPDDLIVETQQHHNGNASVTMSRAKASYKDNSGLDLYSGNVNARVVFEDTYAGIKDATITVYDYTNAVTGTIYAEIGNDGSIEKTEVTGSVNNIIFNDDYTTSKDNLLPKLVIDYVVTNNSNNIKITTSMTDRAGNKTDNVKDSLSIDKTKPVIDVKYDNNEHTTYGGNDYYKADRTATVTVTERNFDESLVEATIMKNGGRYTTIGGWTHNNNTADPDKSTHVAKIVYNTDGDFTFDIAVKDKAMNSADKFTQQKFTVDKTAPVIDVSFDNNSAKNGNYYKADRTATIKITEHNFNSGSQYVNIPVTAEGATAPSVVGWSGSGDDHNATVSFNKDGKYSFTVDYTDLAGNKAVQKKVDSFYIDKTAPEVEITGVADHQAYNGTVAPVVTYRDDNFTDDHDFRFTKIDINGKSDDTSKFDYDTGGNGVTEFIYKYRDFAEVLENDGIYNFTVELSDKAGNSTSKSVTFSVNRFGSTFRTTDELTEKLFESGYTNAEQDIVVEEINVTPLTKHSVTLAKSGGNSTELVENTDYTFTSSNNGNEWCKSVYTVNKKNFSDEAAYTVTIMSVDKAKNTNNNRMANSSLSTEQKNKRECAISFVVDKTSPLVSITGIKDNELYKEASKKVKIVCEDDNLDKSKLVVTLDNKKLAEGEDYTIVDDKDGSIAGMLTAEIVLKAETGGIKENLKVTIGDLAGNTGEKSVDNFILSANIFQIFFANPVLVICTFAGLALVIAAVIFFVAKKRKKAE